MEDYTKPRLLIIGSGTIGYGFDEIYSKVSIEIIGVDVYISSTVDIVCDAHYLPFKDRSFDGVLIQAVLEHVVEPPVVVKEIYRVLKHRGLVYSEIPFMQQVHEGAYDFTRYTLSGHRFLFRDFELISCGGNKGAGVALGWSIRYFLWSITGWKKFSKIISLPFTLLFSILDLFVFKKSHYDSSSGSYFLGRKSSNRIKHSDMIDFYKGLDK